MLPESGRGAAPGMDCDSGRAFHFSWVLAMPRDPERSRAPPPPQGLRQHSAAQRTDDFVVS